MTSAAVSTSAPPQAGDPLERVRLVPVEVFGADEEPCEHCGEPTGGGYGLMDAVPAWSDCNRAIGRIYRVDEESSEPYREPGDTITVYVPQSEMAKFGKRFGDNVPDGRWLTAQVDEDAAAATLAAREGGTWTQDDPARHPGAISSLGGPVVYDEGSPDDYQAAHIARHDPARALREVAFKRTLLIAELPAWVALELARVYEDRPGYAEATGDHRER